MSDDTALDVDDAYCLDWAERFPPGTRYQPSPRIWDLDRDQLWLLISGELKWDDFLSWWKGLKVPA